jgi:DNA polymerase elongation subunit (family B)
MKVSLVADELIGAKQVRQLVRDFRNFFGVRFQDKGHLTRTIQKLIKIDEESKSSRAFLERPTLIDSRYLTSSEDQSMLRQKHVPVPIEAAGFGFKLDDPRLLDEPPVES